jgi:hypothetical protein
MDDKGLSRYDKERWQGKWGATKAICFGQWTSDEGQ